MSRNRIVAVRCSENASQLAWRPSCVNPGAIDNQWEQDWGSILTSQTLVRQLDVDDIRIYQQQ